MPEVVDAGRRKWLMPDAGPQPQVSLYGRAEDFQANT